jgi:diadenosine tetraphosphate (Ap4A) HIT family hydrolase
MSFHANYEQWLAMTEKENCPVCQQLPMPEGMVDIVELPNSWLSAEPVECLRGACHLTAKQHVIELYEFHDDELLAFMKEVQLCAKALKTVTNAVKINYEIHGNSLPHLHVHLYPRYRDDPFPGKAIDYNQKKRIYLDEEFRAFVDEMRRVITACSRGD